MCKFKSDLTAESGQNLIDCLKQAVEEPASGGKEKRRRKLDEIVMGLSAAKEQKTFPDPLLPSSKKQQITPSVSVTPASAPSSSSQQQSSQKPFTITVTSVSGKITHISALFMQRTNRFTSKQDPRKETVVPSYQMSRTVGWQPCKAWPWVVAQAIQCQRTQASMRYSSRPLRPIRRHSLSSNRNCCSNYPQIRHNASPTKHYWLKSNRPTTTIRK